MDKPGSDLMRLTRITKTFGTPPDVIDILDTSDFSIAQGITAAVVGASGIGKSTLLNIIGTLDRPNEGEVLYQGQNLLSLKETQLATFRNERIGFVFQFHYLLQGFTALENVMIPGLIARKPKKKVEYLAVNMLERVGLAGRIHHRVEDLSGGEQQRVAIARALVMKPDMLLADEPTGNLDEKNADSIHSLITELNKELGMTVIVVTHNMKLAHMMEKMVTIQNGKIVPAYERD
ncbi:MAG: ABC transporter ATP-binding protein [Desulfotignum sp.]|nr:ABC transporter ATP-binding protein [Desulfotignum sp.]